MKFYKAKTGIPAAREALERLAKDMEQGGSHDGLGVALRLRTIVQTHLHRRPSVRHTPAKCKRVTPEIAERIRAVAEAQPNASMSQIAGRFGVNLGRVSETLAGFRP